MPMCRSVRKIVAKNVLPPPDEEDEDYEPPFVAKASSSGYNLLEVSQLMSDDSDDDDEEEEEVARVVVVTKKKKIRRRNRGNKNRFRDDITNELDEVEKCVQEVSQILGEVTFIDATAAETRKRLEDGILRVELRHLNVQNEFKRIFGDVEGEKKNRGRPSTYMRLKPYIISPEYRTTFLNVYGLSMSLNREVGELKYFKFDYDAKYQAKLNNYLPVDAMSVFNYFHMQKSHLVENLVECVDDLNKMEKHVDARKLLEETIILMQSNFHHLFVLTDSNIRLEYKFYENRMFFIAILKFIYMLSNTISCHRTALELAKLLIKLDPSDPVAVMLIIDGVALKAWEHEYLIGAIDHWTIERSAHKLPNMQYSYALAYFQALRKQKKDTARASELLEKAIINFPLIMKYIIREGGRGTKVIEHRLFTKLAEESSSEPLKDLCQFYAKFAGPRWMIKEVLVWAVDTAQALTEKYDTGLETRARVDLAAAERMHLFQTYPDEVKRHLSIVKPMIQIIGSLPLSTIPDVRATRLKSPPNDVRNQSQPVHSLAPPAEYSTWTSIGSDFLLNILPNWEVYNRRMEEDSD